MPKRFSKTAENTTNFSEKIYVRCPKCNKRAIIKTEFSTRGNYTTTLVCTYCSKSDQYQSCLYSNREITNNWYGYVLGSLRSSCRFCGERFTYNVTRPNVNPPPEYITCNKCNRTHEYELEWYKTSGSEPLDPYFGLKLYFTIPIKDRTLWVYNFDHLQYIEEYIASDLRFVANERATAITYNLPKEFVSKKNRKLVLKQIGKLKQEMEKYNE